MRVDLYVEQLESLAQMLRTLNEHSAKTQDDSDQGMDFGGPIPVILRFDGSQYGELVDEIGGVWSWRITDRRDRSHDDEPSKES